RNSRPRCSRWAAMSKPTPDAGADLRAVIAEMRRWAHPMDGASGRMIERWANALQAALDALPPREARPEIVQKAWKLIEALAEDCELPRDDDHAWRRCRRCLASEEVDTKEARMLFRVLL